MSFVCTCLLAVQDAGLSSPCEYVFVGVCCLLFLSVVVFVSSGVVSVFFVSAFGWFFILLRQHGGRSVDCVLDRSPTAVERYVLCRAFAVVCEA